MQNQWMFPMIGLFVLLTITRFCMTSWKLESMVWFIRSKTESWNYKFWILHEIERGLFFNELKINAFLYKNGQLYLFDSKTKIWFEQINTNSKFCKNNSGFADSGLVFHLMNLSKDLRKRPLMKTISPAIDILVSSNLERHLWMHLGNNGVKAFLESHT